ncbi:MAG: ATP synthase F1 subunit epsilon [Actinobacteria bacterium]|nr:ATP synthase F1 subunit epsilon [Actinomycetota bacterium]
MTVEVHVVTPEREVWSGTAEQVIARGAEGELGILAGHVPLLVRLSIAPLRIQTEGGDWLMAVVDGGFLHVTSEEGRTRVDVLAAHAELAGEIDLQAARIRKEEAEVRLQSHATRLAEAEMASARAELAKAVARISAAG